MKKAILFFLIPVVVLLFGVFYVSLDHKAEHVKFSAGIIEGVQNAPATYDVTASPSFRWSHTGSVLLVLLSIVLLAVVPAYNYLKEDYTGKRKEVDATLSKVERKENKTGAFWGATIVSWVLAFLLTFGHYSFTYYSHDYQKSVSEQVFKDNAGDLDKLFVK